MKNFNAVFFAVAVAAVFSVSCSKSAKIEGNVSGAGDRDLTIRVLDVNKYSVTDTVRTDAGGNFSYKVQIARKQPEFIYVFYKDIRVASLLLERGDKVKVSADTLGTYSVSGSEESEKLAGVERDLAAFSAGFIEKSARLGSLDPQSEQAAELRREITRDYIDYYRSRVRYVLDNSHSLTVIPVLYQTVGDNLPVFGQETDAIHFRNICDSLETVYPDSKYLKSLKDETKRREQYLNLSMRLNNAEEVSFPELELPDINAVKVRLSEVDAKVIMVHFWTSSDNLQKMFNLDVLAKVYKDFHSKGFEIYQVALDVDKAAWAATVKNQNMPWINVCDGLGANSPAMRLYNIKSLPVSFFIAGGELADSYEISDEASLRRVLGRLLK